MAASDRIYTLVKNVSSRRRFDWIPPNGKWLGRDEQTVVPGVLETEVVLGMGVDQFDAYVDDLNHSRVQITKVGYGGVTEEDYYSAILGNGSQQLFELDVGFATASATVLVYDLFGGGVIKAVQVYLATPTSTSLRLIFNPAPAAGRIQVFVFA